MFLWYFCNIRSVFKRRSLCIFLEVLLNFHPPLI